MRIKKGERGDSNSNPPNSEQIDYKEVTKMQQNNLVSELAFLLNQDEHFRTILMAWEKLSLEQKSALVTILDSMAR